MVRSDYFWQGFTLSCLCILPYFYTVADGRRYDKCTTQDGRQGVCVVKRYCRGASNEPLLPCERDEENHCCPIPTTQRAAPERPPPPPEETPSRPDRWHSGEPKGPDRDDRVNKTPPPGDRRSPSRNNHERPKISHGSQFETDEGRRRPLKPSQEHPRVPSEDRRGDEDKVPRPSSSSHPKDHDRREPPVRRPDADRDEDKFYRPSTSSHSKDHDRREPPARRPDADRFYPSREELDKHRNIDPPRRTNPVSGNPSRKNESDLSGSPISFPNPYEFSVPRPKVPACGVKPYELFIAGGTESEQHEWPWMTAIFRRHSDSRSKTFLCGGSLINTKYVLTAAHCFINNYVVLPASAFVVRLGSHFLNSGEEYTVANLVIHHNHSGSDFFNDIALVRLASEVYVTDKIAPICLPYPEMMRDNLVGRMATVAGWGDTSFRSTATRILQHVTVPVVSGEECYGAYSRVRGAAFLARGSDHVICAGLREGGKDACLGDSGGPLMLKMSDDRWVVVGIVSLGYKCAEPGYPGVYTRVTHYMSWINTNMKKH